jgi:hypothetical protein
MDGGARGQVSASPITQQAFAAKHLFTAARGQYKTGIYSAFPYPSHSNFDNFS